MSGHGVWGPSSPTSPAQLRPGGPSEGQSPGLPCAQLAAIWGNVEGQSLPATVPPQQGHRPQNAQGSLCLGPHRPRGVALAGTGQGQAVAHRFLAALDAKAEDRHPTVRAQDGGERATQPFLRSPLPPPPPRPRIQWRRWGARFPRVQPSPRPCHMNRGAAMGGMSPPASPAAQAGPGSRTCRAPSPNRARPRMEPAQPRQATLSSPKLLPPGPGACPLPRPLSLLLASHPMGRAGPDSRDEATVVPEAPALSPGQLDPSQTRPLSPCTRKGPG